MKQQISFAKTELQPGDLARFEVSVGGQVIGQVYKFRKEHRELWQYEGTPYPLHLFHSRSEAARKLLARATRPRPIFC
jgi:hypothetical protein